MNDASERARIGAERITAAQALMREHGIDALLLLNSTNLLFLSGYPRAELTIARPRYLIIPMKNDPVLLVHGTPTWRSAEWKRPWIRDIRTYTRLSFAPVPELSAIVDQLGLRRSRIGVETGFEQRVGLPISEFERIRDGLAPAEFVDAADLLWKLRRVKTPRDVSLLRTVCNITSLAFDRTFSQIRAGCRDSEVSQMMKMEMVRAGADDPWVYITSGRSGYGIEESTDAPVEPGDMVWMDAGCMYGGFWSDFSRAGVIGKPSAEQRDLQRVVYDLTAECVAMARPGTPVAAIAAHHNARLDQLKLPRDARLFSRMSARMGHGIGYDVTEPPHVAEHDASSLEAGMVIALEPNIGTSFGKFHVEQNLLITESEPEVLSRSPWELRELMA